MSEWQPIETAPRDGTQIIAFRPTVPPSIEAMYWAEFESGGGAWHWVFDGDTPFQTPPTLWIPIPCMPSLET